jgi:hypothetical protein
MSHKKVLRALFLVLAGAWAPVAWADLYQASAAAEKGTSHVRFPCFASSPSWAMRKRRKISP